MKIITLLPLAALVLAGCSTKPSIPDYPCPLHESGAAKCASVEQAYKASRSFTPEQNPRAQTVYEGASNADSPATRPFFKGEASAYPEPGQNGMPVFEQPKVMRVWVAPYVDADGNLRSGEYTYFNTPGQWNYGSLKKPGAASGIFEPANPANLGFTPDTSPKAQQKSPAKPAAPQATPQTPRSAAEASVTPSKGGAASAQTPDVVDGTITQPYQRITAN